MNEVLDSNTLILCFGVVFSFKKITVVYIHLCIIILKVMLTFHLFIF